MAAKRKLCVMGTETMKTTDNIRIQIAEKISALECGVMKKWTRTHQDTGRVLGSGNENA
jgi:hypothetical protein